MNNNKAHFIFFALVMLSFLHFSFMKSANVLHITNKTNEDIDELYLNGGTELIGEHEILHPNETIEVPFDCTKFKKDTKIKIRLVLEDAKIYEYEEIICDGDFAWSIQKNWSKN